jgi:hypothetical protein
MERNSLNVKQLIEELQKLPEHLVVHFQDRDSGAIYGADKVAVTEDDLGEFVIITTEFEG